MEHVRALLREGARPAARERCEGGGGGRIDTVSFARDSADAHCARGLASELDAQEAKSPTIRETLALLEIDGNRVETALALTKAPGGSSRAPSPVVLKPR